MSEPIYLVYWSSSAKCNWSCHANIYVVEIDPAELLTRKCLGKPVKLMRINSPLVLRYWKVAHRAYMGVTTKSQGKYWLEKAGELMELLYRGYKIAPDWERKEKGHGRIQKNDSGEEQPRNGAAVLRCACSQAKAL